MSRTRSGNAADPLWVRGVTTIPGVVYLITLMAAPLLLVVVYAFLTSGRFGGVKLPLTLENLQTLTEPVYRSVIGSSLLVAGVTTLLALLIGYPAALCIARLPRRWQTVALLAVVLPFWTNFLIRTYAWIVLLNSEGLLNDLLRGVGLSPVEILYSRPAVVLGLLYAYIPLMVLPLYASLQRLDPALLEAATNLGAGRWRRFRTITLPLTMTGVLTGALFVFVPSMGNFVIPELLGGGNSQLVGNLIRDQFLKTRDWPLGSAFALVVLAVMVLLAMAQARASRIARARGA